jgi:hypothetical protein
MVATGSLATLAIAPAAQAQPAPTYDPAQLPAVKGRVAQYTLTPRGDVDGVILDDGTEVHFNPMLSTQLVFAIRPGDVVTIHGLKARATNMIAAMSITNDASGTTIAGGAGGGHGPRRAAQTVDATGKIKMVLHEPRGEVNGVLLEDGTIVRLPPPEAKRLASTLTVGAPLVVRGDGLTSPLGKLVMARQIGPDAVHLSDVAAPKPHEGPGGIRGWMHGHMGGNRPDAPKP